MDGMGRTDQITAAEHYTRGPSDEVPESVRIWLLGGFRTSVRHKAIEESEWRLRKAAKLVKLLALVPNHRMHRERAMDLLWPDLDPKAAANNLRHALHVARRTLEKPSGASASPRFLLLSGEVLELYPDVTLWVDVEAFERAVESARRAREPTAYEAALDLYAGDLLPEDRYEGWAEARREELRTLYLTSLVELATLYEERGEFGSAIEELRQVVTAEPTHDRANVGLMRLYALSGRRSAALGQYEQLRETLSRELGVEPSATDRQLYQEILTGRFPPASLLPTGSLPKESSGTDRHNLPTARTNLVGREQELAEVKRALTMTRLLTLTGPCGSGKTRLALKVAYDLIGAYPDGAWLVELATLSEGWLVQQAVAAELHVREQPNRPLFSTLVEALREKKMLLVLDNCEHLIDAAAYLVDALLCSCPHLRVLATSREALGVAGEVKWMVPPLPLPNLRHPLTVEELAGFESIRLFLERARYHHPAFVLTTQNVEAVTDVCRQLEGLPLAIELAAARISTLSVKQIATRLRDPLGLLTMASRTAPPRERTLRGALDWGYALLAEPERKLFRWLSVFADGWTLEAAETVGVGDGIQKEDVLDLLSRLVDKSLVVAEANGDGTARYRMLELVRRYGWEKLEESGEEAEVVKCRHAAFFFRLADEAEPELRG